MEQGPPQVPPTPEQEPILTFEEFIYRDPDGIPYHSNFCLHFIAGLSGDTYRTTKYYKKFASEHSEIATLLCKEIQNTWDKYSYTYKLMRSCGASDQELFS